MEISDEDADEVLLALSREGFSMPFADETVAVDDRFKKANRRALKAALEDTDAWNRYRIY